MIQGPDFSLEEEGRALLGEGAGVCGVDEAGRGPLSGPVVAAAVLLDPTRTPEGIDDSKRLSRTRRERLAIQIQECAWVGTGIAEVGEIDRLNILQATLLAMRRALEALPVRPAQALIDGNQAPKASGLDCKMRTVVGGDRKSLSIAAASIIAKTCRDRIMRELAVGHPGYGWERNVGYPTAAHLEALVRLGPTEHHRASFRPVREALRRLESA